MKKFIAIVLACIFMVSLQSCKGNMTYDDLDSVTYENMLRLPEGSYIVIAYQDNCANCDDLLGTIKDYLKFCEKHPEAKKIFGIDVNLIINQDMVIGKDDPYPSNMESTGSYKKCKVKATPAIFVVEDKHVVKVISDYNETKVVDKAKEYFKELMK